MKRRGFLGLLGLAPAAPLIAKEITQVRPPSADDHIRRIKKGMRETFPSLNDPVPLACWQLQPLDENQQPWMGEWPRNAECAPIRRDDDDDALAEADLSITLPVISEWIGQPMPAYVRTYFMGKPVLTMPSGAWGQIAGETLTIIQRVNIG